MDIRREKIGERIREVREKSGFSQEALGRVIGRGKGSVHKYEKGAANPEISVLAEIAKFGGVSLDWLIIGDVDEEQIQPSAPEAPNDSFLLPRDFLRSIIEEVEIGEKESGVNLSPQKKAQLVLMLCDLFKMEDNVDRATILKLIRLAA